MPSQSRGSSVLICSNCSNRPAGTPHGLCGTCAASASGAAPAAAAPVPPGPPGAVLRSPIGLSYAVTALLGLVVVADLLGAYAAVTTGSLMRRLREGGPGVVRSDVVDADRLMTVSSVFQVAALLATAVVFLVWFHRVRGNAGVFGPEHQRRGSGWAIGSWFIPVANLWIPRQVAGDIWRASETGRHSSRAILNGWWALWVVALVVDRIAARAYGVAEDPEALGTAADMLVFSAAVDIAAAFLAVLFVRRLTAMQHAKALAGPPRAAVAPTAPAV